MTMLATASAATPTLSRRRSLVKQRRRAFRLCIALAATFGGRRLSAQLPLVNLVRLGQDTDERLRLGQLLGTANPDGYLIRSASRLTPIADPNRPWTLRVLGPEYRAVHNSALPFSLNDGPLWAGVGWNQEVSAGFLARYGTVRLIVAPSYVQSNNGDFQVIPTPQITGSTRSRWANPFHPLPESIDLPIRFGDRPIRRLDPGQSSLTVDAHAVAFGFATENLWWGPGIVNAIVLSDNAAGFPHLFVQAPRPWHTRAGTFDAQWILGQLTESSFFDFEKSNDHRSLSGLAATWTTPFDTNLTLGVTRLVMGARSNGAFPLSAAFDVLKTVGHLNVDTGTVVPAGARDQVTSLFARWLFPGAGLEAYAEWARFEEPRSIRDFLEFPGHSEGYTLGFQWAHPFERGRAFRLQAEASYLEPDPSLRLRPVAITYTSRAVPQGFTNRGQTLGAAIGPGSSSQWLAGDYFAPWWRIGPYLGRIRWDNGVLPEPIVPDFKRQDVSLLAGVRGGVSWQGLDLLADFSHAARFNYLFQSYVTGVGAHVNGIDLLNNTFSVTVSAPLRLR